MSDTHALLEQRLKDEKAILEQELSALGKRNPSNPDDWVAAKPEGEEFGADLTDNADVIADQHDKNAALNELEARLRLVSHALSKFAKGTYGVCEVSGEPIEAERLNANPAARTSIAHMDKESMLTV